MKNNDIAVSVTSLRKSFGNHQVLKGVDFSVRKGEIFALLGSNGAGKTTTVKILTTLQNPDEGYCEINGFNVVKETRQVRECISLTGQYAAVDENLTGMENLMMIGALRHLQNSRNQAMSLLAEFELADAAKRRVATYSGGMRRKLDLAMSLMGTPSIIFLDEPTTGLDPQSRVAMWKIIKALSESGTTIFLTTQYLEEAEQLANNIAILHEGRIITHGTLGELKKRFPPAKIEYIEKQPTLEEIFMTIINEESEKGNE